MIQLLGVLIGIFLVLNLFILVFQKIQERDKTRCIYADNNASTPMSQKSIEAWVQGAQMGCSNPSSYHFGGRRSRYILEEKRQELAQLVGCDKSELVFTSGSTESNNTIIHGLVDFFSSTAQKESNNKNNIGVITTPIEHASVTEPLEELTEKGVIKLHIAPVQQQTGYVRLDAIEDILKNAHERGERIVMMCIIVGNNETGTLQDMPAILRLAKEHGIFLHADMTQILGKYKINLKELGVDSASFSGHKFHGPKGIGCLFIRNNRHLNINAYLRGGKQEMGYRAGTENIASVCAMVAALRVCYKRIEEGESDAVRTLRDDTLRLLNTYLGDDKFKVFGDPEKGLYNTLCVGLPVNSRTLIQKMNQDGHHIYVNTGCACSQGQGSKVLKAIGASEEEINGSMRISYGFLNKPRDAKCVARVVANYVQKIQEER